ncbi:MAG: FAD:protein FMN transferase [Phycisphaerales bacterium]|nr:FAD:protein FMN transferase [Phycisphaerales bacterium]
MLVRLATHAMGTRFELVLAGSDEVMLRAAGEEALAEIEAWDAALSLFRRDSRLSHINRHAAAAPVRVDPLTLNLIDAALEVARRSRGAFDPTVAPLMRQQGFHQHGSGAGDPDSVGADGVEIDHEHATIRFRRAGMALDLGGIAKGHAIDLAAEILRDAGVTTALIHGGTSTIRALGTPPGARGWGIRLAHAPVDADVDLCDQAMSVSSPSGRTITAADGERGHVLDPRTGRSAEAAVAVTIGPSARDADAWSTALLVLEDVPASLPAEITGYVDTPAGPRARGPLAHLFPKPQSRKSDQCSTSTVVHS